MKLFFNIVKRAFTKRWVIFLHFVVVVVVLWGHTQWHLGFSWICIQKLLLLVLRGTQGYPGLKPGRQHARQIPYTQCYHSVHIFLLEVDEKCEWNQKQLFQCFFKWTTENRLCSFSWRTESVNSLFNFSRESFSHQWYLVQAFAY